MNVFAKIVGTIAVGVASIVAIGLIISLPVMLLWNFCLVGAVAGVQPIGWLQSWGILILCGFLFKSSLTVKKD